ncbi:MULTISPECIES: ABC transporter permease [unclassified Flavobacterium]|uniref:ABC transporter permease n=1 Tax=unclassified Flavobacterium TaxID=196869 RepID=UPI001F13CC81|nr:MULTISPECIES: ABC transporter permease [unclassified Flavobacterium]UMY65676.1 ABC transporter permease [Flavobacterium sp. HJ-32-4]
MRVLSLIIRREFNAKVRNKAFIVMTFLSPLIFVGIALLIGFLSTMKADTKFIAVHDASGLFVGDFKNSDEFHFHNVSTLPLQTVKDSILSERLDGVLVIPNEKDPKKLAENIQFISNDDPGIEFIGGLENTISKRLTKANYARTGLDSISIRQAQADVSIHMKKADGTDSMKGLNWFKAATGGLFGYLIMMFIIIYGNFVMRSVIEEKTNRIIEIIISSVRPFHLMMGKIIGTSLAGVLQFAIWAVVGFTLLFVATQFFGLDVATTQSTAAHTATQEPGFWPSAIRELSSLPLFGMAVCFLVYFVGGYFLYSSFYAAIGAAVDSETDSQQFLFPIVMPLVLGVYIGFFTVINDPHGTVATVFSFIPLTSPIVMLMRLPFGVPWWQVVVSIVILYGTFYGVVWFAAKIYRVGILMYGKKPTWKELIRWMRY